MRQDLPIEVLDILPNPVLVKDSQTRYVWVNDAFKRLFAITDEQLIGQLDADVFQARQVAQCNGGDLRVLESGEIDEAHEIVIDPELGERHTITRKSRLEIDGERFLVGVMHDVTDVTEANEQLKSYATQLAEKSEALHRMANTDPLTGLVNRRNLFTTAADLFNRKGGIGGLIAADLDSFKQINDAHGHAAGDAALVHFATKVNEVTLASDLSARLGGEEFVIALPGMTRDETIAIAAKLCELVRNEPVAYEGTEISMTVSLGVVHKACNTPFEFEAWLAKADKQLYRAKEAGRDQYVVAP